MAHIADYTGQTFRGSEKFKKSRFAFWLSNSKIQKRGMKMTALQKVQFESIHDCLHKDILRHETRVAETLRILAGFLPSDICFGYGLSDEALQTAFYKGGLYHDVGKILFDHRLFRTKSGNVSITIRTRLHQHPNISADLLNEFASGIFDNEAERRICVDIARHHRKRIDGKGYPVEINATISLSAQLCNLADTFDDNIMNSPMLLGINHAFETAYKETMSDFGLVAQDAMDCFSAAKKEIKKKYCSKKSVFRNKRMLDMHRRISESQFRLSHNTEA